jgi:hypothetical protein
MRTRVEILQSLITCDRPLLDIQQDIKTIPWESEQPLAFLKREDLIHVLFRYLNGDLTREEVRDWAEELDTRHDIGKEKGYRDLIIDVVFELSTNPYLGDSLTPKKAEELINELSQAKYDESDVD